MMIICLSSDPTQVEVEKLAHQIYTLTQRAEAPAPSEVRPIDDQGRAVIRVVFFGDSFIHESQV